MTYDMICTKKTNPWCAKCKVVFHRFAFYHFRCFLYDKKTLANFSLLKNNIRGIFCSHLPVNLINTTYVCMICTYTATSSFGSAFPITFSQLCMPNIARYPIIASRPRLAGSRQSLPIAQQQFFPMPCAVHDECGEILLVRQSVSSQHSQLIAGSAHHLGGQRRSLVCLFNLWLVWPFPMVLLVWVPMAWPLPRTTNQPLLPLPYLTPDHQCQTNISRTKAHPHLLSRFRKATLTDSRSRANARVVPSRRCTIY